MNRVGTVVTLILSLSMAGLPACSVVGGVQNSHAGSVRYLCCNLWVDRDGNASDAGYTYADSQMLRAGSRVTIVSEGAKTIRFRDERHQEFSLAQRFGSAALAPSEYFALLFLEESPAVKLGGLPAWVQAAIRDGKLVPGLTKEQALVVRGYPPLHRTPKLAAKEWVYFNNRTKVSIVTFENDRVVDIAVVDEPVSYLY